MDLFYILIIFVIIYILDKLNVIQKIKDRFINIEHFSQSDKKFIKDFNFLEDNIPCEIPKKLKKQIMSHNYISYEAYPHINDYIILTMPNKYLTNQIYINKMGDYINFIEQHMSDKHILEQLIFNVYNYKDRNITDLVGIVPEYILEPNELMDNLNKENKYDSIRYICGVSHTYYYFITSISSGIISIENLNGLSENEPVVVNILYDKQLLGGVYSNVSDKETLENKLIQSYKNNNELMFIKDYIKDITSLDIVYKPLHYIKYDSNNNKIILGNNNLTHEILKTFEYFNGYHIFGFDYNKHFGETIYHTTTNHTDVVEEEVELEEIKGLLDIESKTKRLLHKYKLHNALIKTMDIFMLQKNVFDCENYKYQNKDNIEKQIHRTHVLEEEAEHHNYTYCKGALKYFSKHIDKRLFTPVKTFLFRNVAITNKYTNNKFVYNLLYVLMNKINIDNKLSLMSLKTNLAIHDGAREFYIKYGFISDTFNIDCMYDIGKEKCSRSTRNRFSI